MYVSAQRLRSFIPLQGLMNESLALLAQYAKVSRLKQDTILFKIGDHSPYSYLLLDGEIEISTKKGTATILRSDHEDALYPIGNLVPRQVNAKIASTEAILVRLDRNLLEKELTWGQIDYNQDMPALCKLSGLPQDNQEWIQALLHTPIFFRLPMSNIQLLFKRFREISYAKNEVIIREGDPGDSYFIIRSGTCKVVRNNFGNEIVLGRMEAPEGFGEQALIAEQPRNATVVMETSGSLMSLAKKDFISLMQAPLQKRVQLSKAMKWVHAQRGRLLDVRSETEFNRGHLAEARNIPLYLLYLKSTVFAARRHYIVYCDSGARSEAAAFLLTKKGFDSYVLDKAAENLAMLR
ncbi:hypothetical protein TI05_06455 [Achromatium sp. WMS3]|nr:hypothetical protein TI05_06455 [Achromatium sp. WMS3]